MGRPRFVARAGLARAAPSWARNRHQPRPTSPESPTATYGPSGTGTGTGTFTARPAIQGHALVVPALLRGREGDRGGGLGGGAAARRQPFEESHSSQHRRKTDAA